MTVTVKKTNAKMLPYKVVVDGRIVGEHNVLETAELHKKKILTPIKPAMYKGKKL